MDEMPQWRWRFRSLRFFLLDSDHFFFISLYVEIWIRFRLIEYNQFYKNCKSRTNYCFSWKSYVLKTGIRSTNPQVTQNFIWRAALKLMCQSYKPANLPKNRIIFLPHNFFQILLFKKKKKEIKINKNGKNYKNWNGVSFVWKLYNTNVWFVSPWERRWWASD